MNVGGKHYRTIWLKDGDSSVAQIIDQRLLPHQFFIADLRTVDEVARAIKDMLVRGAGLIGATAGYGMYIAALTAPSHSRESFLASLEAAARTLKATRPTAVNLAWAVDRQLASIARGESPEEMIALAQDTAQQIADEDA